MPKIHSAISGAGNDITDEEARSLVLALVDDEMVECLRKKEIRAEADPIDDCYLDLTRSYARTNVDSLASRAFLELIVDSTAKMADVWE